ncbi:unnamed protein product [Blepharisma stoltei]|uniref:RRM domain-containing protein n=1 Tax=Blepharisma stoltei TaxID=1481888 RepID=A0AAU9J972_9CILI|nr:unnamed protein product [Blepharisma stoltei]
MASSSSKGFYLRGGFQRYLSTYQGKNHYPIPRQQTPYAFAKVAEYIEKDLSKAESLYRQAIEIGERPESALKDLAGVLHQQGKTEEACELLINNKHLFVADLTRYENLLRNLQKQIFPSQNSYNKSVKISGLGPMADELTIRSMFSNPSRILHIEIYSEPNSDGKSKYGIIRFASHSAARKTLEGFGKHYYKLEWVALDGEITGEVSFEGTPEQEFSLFSSGKEKKMPGVFDYYTYFAETKVEQNFEDKVDEILENSLLSYVRSKCELKASANPFEPDN